MLPFVFKQSQFLKMDLSHAWDFFSNPSNLSEITPPSMGFKILSPLPAAIHTGLKIRYQVRPLLGIPMTWVTRIEAVDPPFTFVDVQEKGPFSSWRHLHRFRSEKDGVMMEDEVEYLPPLGFLGKAVHPFLIRPRLQAIFAFRREVLLKRFGGIP